MKIFSGFKNFGCGVQFFVPDDGEAYAQNKPCTGFGSVRYGEGSLYCGGLYFNGVTYEKLGFGRQDFMLSDLGALNPLRKIRKAFYLGEFDYRKTDWIYGNGVLYYVDENNRPAYFMKGFFEGLNKTGEYRGRFDPASLAAGYAPEMEREFDDASDVFETALSGKERLTSLDHLFLGDSYFEFWNSRAYAGRLFEEEFDPCRNLNLGVGGTRFCDWVRFLPKLEGLKKPKRIVLNLGFNDVHGGRTPAQVFEDYQGVLRTLKGLFPAAEYVLLGVVKAPAFLQYFSAEEEFNALTRASAQEFGVEIVDMRAAIERENSAENCFAADNVHLNAYGYRIFAQEIKKVLI